MKHAFTRYSLAIRCFLAAFFVLVCAHGIHITAFGAPESGGEDSLHPVYVEPFPGEDADGSSNPHKISLGMFTTTGYCSCEVCTSGLNITYSGAVPKANHTVAADLSLYPLGTRLMIDGVIYTVEDKGSCVNGKEIDIFYSDHASAVAHGQTTQEVFLIQ